MGFNNTGADKYFVNQIKKCSVYHICRNRTFIEYLKLNYTDNCFFYAPYAVMCLKTQDKAMQGKIRVPDTDFENGGYVHCWVEFEFEGKTYIFDPPLTTKGSPRDLICLKDEWYAIHKPEDVSFKTQNGFLDYFEKAKDTIITKSNGLNKMKVAENCFGNPGIDDVFSQSTILYDDNKKIKEFHAVSW